MMLSHISWQIIIPINKNMENLELEIMILYSMIVKPMMDPCLSQTQAWQCLYKAYKLNSNLKNQCFIKMRKVWRMILGRQWLSKRGVKASQYDD